MEHYDYIIVGSGLFGATVANRLNKKWQIGIGYRQTKPHSR